MKTFVIGDIHGAYKALVQCLERSHFDRGEDRLIALGDVCDGYPDVKRSIEELLTIKHCDYILGNHDLWALEWAKEATQKPIWVNQGGANTIVSYEGQAMLPAHVDFLKNAHPWITCDSKLFVHGGIDPSKGIESQDPEILVWDRSLVMDAWEMSQENPKHKFSDYEEIFVGHTPTQNLARRKAFISLKPAHRADPGDKPLFLCNVIMMDTGAGWSGRLTIMDIHSHEFWQSDPTPLLYGVRGR